MDCFRSASWVGVRDLSLAFSFFHRRRIHNCADQSLIFDFVDFLFTIYRIFTPPFLHKFTECWRFYFVLPFFSLAFYFAFYCQFVSSAFRFLVLSLSRTLAFVRLFSHSVSSFLFIPNSRFRTIEIVILEMFVCAMQTKVSEYLTFCTPWIQSTFINEWSFLIFFFSSTHPSVLSLFLSMRKQPLYIPFVSFHFISVRITKKCVSCSRFQNLFKK